MLHQPICPTIRLKTIFTMIVVEFFGITLLFELCLAQNLALLYVILIEFNFFGIIKTSNRIIEDINREKTKSRGKGEAVSQLRIKLKLKFYGGIFE
jgi:hypothetical protein